MKRIIFIILLIVALTLPLMGQGATRWNIHQRPTTDWFSGAVGRDIAWEWMKAIDPLVAAGSQVGTGNIFYVDSNVTNAGDGSNWANAKDTLDKAVALCADNNGDIIYVAQGHAETWTAVDSADLDVIGITVIGIGQGTDRPTFTYTTATAGELVIAAANVKIRNLVFQSGIANVVHAIEIEADADGSVIEFCEFLSGTTDAYEFVDAIQVIAAADDLIIRYNKATETTAGAVSWLDLSAGVVDNISVYGNEIYGDYSTGIVDSTARAQTLAYFGFNTMTNLSADDYAFYFNAAATGVLEFNRIYTNAEATAIDPGSMSCFENYVTTTTDKSGMIYPAPDTGSTQLNATTVTAIATAVDALSGVGMIGLCETNITTTTVISGALGGYGNDVFNESWSLVCIFDTAGAVGTLPSGEVRDITDYVSATGTFTTAAWTAALTAGDYVLLTPTHLLPAAHGKIIYCDDGGSDGEGTSWQTAKVTLAKAEALAVAGDTILIGESHNENITTGGDTIDIAGVTVIGMGEGDTRPLFDFDAAADEITLDAAGITLKNLRFRPGATVVVAALRIEDTALGATIENCSFVDGEVAATDEFVDAISVDTLAADLTVRNCTYYSTGTNTNTFVNLDEATIANTSIIGCMVFGAFAESPIWAGNAVPTNILIKDNVITNTTSGELCIEFQGAATGMIVGNRLYSDTFGSVLNPGSATCVENYASNAINTSAYLVPSIDDELAEVGTGRIFYVDASTPGAGDGRAWDTAVATLDAAVNLCTDDRGDTIYVAQGHTETVISDFVDIDLGGITIIGLGNGKLRPYFDYTTGVGSSMIIDNDDITIKNLWFHANIDSIAVAIEVKTGALDATIEDCLFTCESATDEFDICIDHAAGNHGAVVKNCDFRMGAANAVSAVHFIDSDYAEITDNTVSGDYSTACFHNETTASDHILVKDNDLFNGTIGGGENTEPGIEFHANTSGMIVGNNIVCLLDAPGEAIVAADCYLFGNKYNGLESSSGARDIGLVAGKTYATSWSETLYISDDAWIVAGGPIMITSLTGIITTAYDGALTHTWWVDAETAAQDHEFTTSVDIDAYLIGEVLVFTAVNPAVITNLTAGATNGGSGQLMSPWFCPIGTIETLIEGPTATAGDIIWYMTFIPLTEGVTVTAQ